MRMLPRHHQLVRFVAAVVTAGSLTYVGHRAQLRGDVTAEGLSRITAGTEELIAGIGAERPVTVHAFVSPDVPPDFVPVRSRLLNILRQMQADGGAGLQVRIVEPKLYSAEAEEAVDKYGISPRMVFDSDGRRVETFLGLAFVSGPREEVIPFLDRGLSVEYEVARALRVVIQDKKKVVGILRTDAAIMGNFDLQARRQEPAWRIVEELRKQYEVRSLNPGAPIPDDVDVVLVPQLSSCTQQELEGLKTYVDAGRPALLTVDPMPLFDIRLAPREPKLPPPGQGNMFGGGGGGGEPKGDYRGFLDGIGVTWEDDKILYDTFNPHPSFRDVPPHVVFVADRPDGTHPFDSADPASDGLSEVVALFAGEIAHKAGDSATFVPLLSTGRTAGFNVFDDMVQRHMLFGVQGPVVPRKRSPITHESHVIGARIKSDTEGAKRNLIVIADLDLIGDQFFAMHERGGDIDGDGLDDIRFDNVTFLLNAVDSLTGDDRFLELRRRKPMYRRLTLVDDMTRAARDEREKDIEEANAKAEDGIKEAQAALEGAVAAIRDKQGLDETTKSIMLKSAEEAENRRLRAKQDQIEREKSRAIAKTEREHKRAIDDVQNWVRLFAVLVPPLPALAMGFWITARKRRREREAIPASRRMDGKGGKS